MEHIQHRQADTHNDQIVVGNLRRDRHFLRRTGDEEPHDPASQQQHGTCDHRTGRHRNRHRAAHAGANALKLPGSQILSHIGDHRVAVRGRGDLKNAIQLVGRGKSGQKRHAKYIDNGLNDHAAYRDHDILQCHRQSQRHQSQRCLGFHTEIFPFQCHKFDFSKTQETENTRKHLRDERSRRRARDAPAKSQNEQQIQRDIAQRGKDHRTQRRATISQRAQGARQQVVCHDDGNAKEHDAQI